MSSEDKQIVLRVVEHYIRTGSASDDHVNVICLPVDKTSYVEHTGEDGRTLLLDEYRLDGKVIWAAYSPRSETVYLSPKSELRAKVATPS
jgi:hypothetical protein